MYNDWGQAGLLLKDPGESTGWVDPLWGEGVPGSLRLNKEYIYSGAACRGGNLGCKHFFAELLQKKTPKRQIFWQVFAIKNFH